MSHLAGMMAPMTDSEGLEPPGSIAYRLEEALDLLADLEDARDSLLESGHLTAVLAIEAQIALLSRKLQLDGPEGDDDAD